MMRMSSVGMKSLISITNPIISPEILRPRRGASCGSSTVRLKIGCVAGGLLSARHSLNVIIRFKGRTIAHRLQHIQFVDMGIRFLE